MLFILKKLVENTLNNPKNEKMRKINLSNAKIADAVAQYPSNVRFFQVLGWDEVEEGLALHDSGYNQDNLKLGLESIESFALKLQKMINSLGKTGISGTSGSTNIDVSSKSGGLTDHGGALERELQRRKDMIKPIKNRGVTYKYHDEQLKLKKIESQQKEHEMFMGDQNEEMIVEDPQELSHADLVRIQEMCGGNTTLKHKVT